MIKSLALVVALTTIAASLAACAVSAAPESSSQNASAVRASEPAADLAGTWAFDLDHSEVAGPIKEDCKAKAAGDAAKQTACWNAISEEARREKIRFSKSEGGRSTWTSFGEEAGKKEIVFLEIPLELAADGPGHVLAKVAGKPTGLQAEQFAKSNTNTMRIEVVDAKTIAMTDPKKGRLVFNKE